MKAQVIELPEGMTEDQSTDAVTWWQQLSGRATMDWMTPGAPVTMNPHDVAGKLARAA